MYVVDYQERDEIPVDMPGSKGTTMRWLVGRRSGARTYAMRYFEIQPGGIIPLHQHPEEHEIFILEGKAELLGGQEGMTAQKDDVVFIEPDEPHGYDNSEGKDPFRFICVIPLLEE